MTNYREIKIMERKKMGLKYSRTHEGIMDKRRKKRDEEETRWEET